MTPDLRAKVQAELNRLTEKDTPAQRERFAESFWRNIDHWEERFRTDSARALEDLGAAQLERILVTEHRGSPQYAQAQKEDFMRRTTPEAREACGQFRPSARKTSASD